MNHTNTEEGTSDTGSPVLAMLVAEGERLDFLPRHFGRQMMIFETAVYAQTRLLSAEYVGGYWKMYDCWRRPKFDPPVRVVPTEI